MKTAGDQISYLARSTNRPLVLQAIKNKSSTPSELVDQCSISRATVQRILTDFETHGWITKNSGMYHLTAAGSLILNIYDGTITQVEQVIESEPVLRRFAPGNEPPVQPLSESEIVVPSDDQPHAPVFHYRKQIARRAIDAKIIIDPIMNPAFSDVHHKLYKENQSVDVILSSEFKESVENSQWLRNITFDNLYIHSDDLSVGLVLSEQSALAIVYDEDQFEQVCIDGTNEELVRWFSSYAEMKKANAELFADSQLHASE